jgi:hypothetical protein
MSMSELEARSPQGHESKSACLNGLHPSEQEVACRHWKPPADDGEDLCDPSPVAVGIVGQVAVRGVVHDAVVGIVRGGACGRTADEGQLLEIEKRHRRRAIRHDAAAGMAAGHRGSCNPLQEALPRVSSTQKRVSCVITRSQDRPSITLV